MKRFNTVVMALVCALAAGPVQALDPLSLIVLRMIRDHVASAQLEAALAPAETQRGLALARPARYPPNLRTLVDEGFPQLSAAQRDAVHQRLTEMINDPQYAAQRDQMLNDFVEAASAARRSHEALGHLTDAQKRTIAVQAAAAYRDRDPEALQEAIATLRSAAMPIPADLRELMLAAFGAESARTR